MSYKNRQSVLPNQHSSVEVYEGIVAGSSLQSIVSAIAQMFSSCAQSPQHEPVLHKLA